MQFFPIFQPQVGISCLRTDAFHFSSPQPINDSFVVNMNHRGTDKTQKGRQLDSLDGALHLKFSLKRAIHQAHRPQFSVLIQLNN